MALRGFKVIELAGLAPGPFCGLILRDHGASVIRVDKPNTHPHADTMARGKRSLVLDFKKPEAAGIFSKLCLDADVLIDPFRPGVMEKFKLGPTEMCKANPKLIYARMTGFGQSGPFSKMAGHDINYIAISGVLSMLGGPKKPAHPINLMGDFAGGGLVCALGICLALLERYSSGKGQVIDANMVEGSAYVSSFLWTTRTEDYPAPIWINPRGKNILDGGSHFYQTYKTKDGKFMAVGAIEPHFHKELLKGLNLDKEYQYQINNPEMITKLEEVFRTKTQEEWCKIFDLTDACVTPVIPLEEAHTFPHNKERNSFMLQDGDKVVPVPAPRLSRTPAVPELRNPLPGQHSLEILLEKGFERKEIDSYIQKGIVHSLDMQSSL
ncbi:hypothetical protein JTE90_020286 [Oedothorax gibbosus]|uniref:Alpha-methylacyl-CoA racemase n=1 Tax=Oedothorax gibbosus TaxID=931172 RepID=A0AAV6VM75_9ARAC|nr:hypothetical protein JTE90_020286 [Oedothorax gibbosus]